MLSIMKTLCWMNEERRGMEPKSVLDEIMSSICSVYGFEETAPGRCLVHTGMYYDDGDELHIVMAVSDGEITMTDEGHTMMWLSFEEHRFSDYSTDLLNRIMGQNGVSLDDGVMSVTVNSPGDVGPALVSLIQAMIQASDLRYLNRSMW